MPSMIFLGSNIVDFEHHRSRQFNSKTEVRLLQQSRVWTVREPLNRQKDYAVRKCVARLNVEPVDLRDDPHLRALNRPDTVIPHKGLSCPKSQRDAQQIDRLVLVREI